MRQLGNGEDCHNRLSALALSEVGEDLYGLKKRSEFRSHHADAALRPKETSGSGVAFSLASFGAKVAVKQRALGGHATSRYIG
jgi:hypothetical protein